MVLKLEEAVLALLPTVVAFVVMVFVSVDMVLRPVRPAFNAAVIWAGVEAPVRLARALKLDVLLVISAESVLTLLVSVLEFVVIAVPAFVSAVAESFMFDPLVCRFPGSTRLAPNATSSTEIFFW